MSQVFCDWCGQPAVEGRELCANCLAAQSKENARSQISAPETSGKKKDVIHVRLHWVRVIAVVMLKGLGYMVMGTIMVVAALFGACGILMGTGSFASGYPLLFIILGFGIAVLMGKLMQEMSRFQPRLLKSEDEKRGIVSSGLGPLGYDPSLQVDEAEEERWRLLEQNSQSARAGEAASDSGVGEGAENNSDLKDAASENSVSDSKVSSSDETSADETKKTEAGDSDA